VLTLHYKNLGKKLINNDFEMAGNECEIYQA